MDTVRVFDTTLGDGEQSPGFTMNMQEKLDFANQLVRLGVDVIEAGFPISSPGDFEAVRTIAQQVRGTTIAGALSQTAGAMRRMTMDPSRPLVDSSTSLRRARQSAIVAGHWAATNERAPGSNRRSAPDEADGA